MLIGTVAFASFDGPSILAGRRKSEQRSVVVAEVRQLLETAKLLKADPTTIEVAAELEAAAAELGQQSDPKQAAQTLRRTAERLSFTDEASRLSERAAVRGLERELATSPLAAGADAATQFERLATDAEANVPSVAQAAQIADRLSALAEAERSGNPATAEALERAANSLKSGKSAQAAAALRDAASAQRRATTAVKEAAARRAIANDLEASASRLDTDDLPSPQAGDGSRRKVREVTAQRGRSGGTQSRKTSGAGQNTNAGEASDPTEGASKQDPSGKEAGPRTQPGQPKGDAAPGDDEGQLAGRSGNAGDASGIGLSGPQGGDPSRTAGAGDAPSIGAPAGSIAPTNGPTLLLPSAPGVANGRRVGAGNVLSPSGATRVPLSVAVGKSREQATEALTHSDLAPTEQRLVRDYFDELVKPISKSGDRPPAPNAK